MNILGMAVFLSSSAFYFYGVNCLISKHMVHEFIRFGLGKKSRLLTGYLQLLGASGLLYGFFFSPVLVFIASTGLTVLMILGFAVRIKIKDSLMLAMPSLIFAFINLYICIEYYKMLF
ncbi:DoxX family protein [Maribacter hydrothermalis]|uniref:DoxX family protein n=1 Tax=Maribacter hydrothermalis TaxID=1836467 RepID=UPI000941BC7B|nr:DoxX family protein [Maribacter hydrothermalis]APQ18609.1 hypothetical protein BTR34_15355 [Maribacter hydrothermalis]